jgi:hypothetical protein
MQSFARRAAENAPSKVASDYYRFQLLTGCRGVEICGHKLHEYRRSGGGRRPSSGQGASTINSWTGSAAHP